MERKKVLVEFEVQTSEWQPRELERDIWELMPKEGECRSTSIVGVEIKSV